MRSKYNLHKLIEKDPEEFLVVLYPRNLKTINKYLKEKKFKTEFGETLEDIIIQAEEKGWKENG